MPRLLLGFALLLFSTAQTPAQARKSGWHTSYAAAKAEARKTGKPIFLVFRCEP
jgi:hypothetical protein